MKVRSHRNLLSLALCGEEFLPQRRKGAKRYRVPEVFLCVFAPLREKFPSKYVDIHEQNRETDPVEERTRNSSACFQWYHDIRPPAVHCQHRRPGVRSRSVGHSVRWNGDQPAWRTFWSKRHSSIIDPRSKLQSTNGSRRIRI